MRNGGGFAAALALAFIAGALLDSPVHASEAHGEQASRGMTDMDGFGILADEDFDPDSDSQSYDGIGEDAGVSSVGFNTSNTTQTLFDTGCPSTFEDTTPTAQKEFTRANGCDGDANLITFKTIECTCETCTDSYTGDKTCLPECNVTGNTGKFGILSAFDASLPKTSGTTNFTECNKSVGVIEDVYINEYMVEREATANKFQDASNAAAGAAMTPSNDTTDYGTKWNTSSSYTDVFSDGKDGYWAKRLMANLEARLNAVPMPGGLVGCQATMGLAATAHGRYTMNCCPFSCPAATLDTSPASAVKDYNVGGRPFTMDEEAMDATTGGWIARKPCGDFSLHGQTPACVEEKQADGTTEKTQTVPLCQWPNNTKPADSSIHMIRIAACGSHWHPICAMIKVVKKAGTGGAVKGFGQVVSSTTVPDWNPPIVMDGISSSSNLYGHSVFMMADAKAGLLSFLDKADSVIRKAIATLRFEVARKEIYSETLDEICLPKACPTIAERKVASPDVHKVCSVSSTMYPGFCMSTCQRTSPDYQANSTSGCGGVPAETQFLADAAEPYYKGQAWPANNADSYSTQRMKACPNVISTNNCPGLSSDGTASIACVANRRRTPGSDSNKANLESAFYACP